MGYYPALLCAQKRIKCSREKYFSDLWTFVYDQSVSSFRSNIANEGICKILKIPASVLSLGYVSSAYLKFESNRRIR